MAMLAQTLQNNAELDSLLLIKDNSKLDPAA